ncbi:MAG TPA: hypothetical protein VGX68_02540 [Thermoanaerobaculia bacterium]|jgi:hypothetical protein|nr:hypothetical protein [Thermoanaerobaculia bacterium]
MSLISDALKKARQDVARQDALRPRAPYAVGAADPPRRRFPFLPLLAGLGGGGLMVGLVLAFAWSAGWEPFGAAKSAVRTAEAVPPPPVTSAAEPAAVVPSEQPEPAPAARPQAAVPASASPVREDLPPAVAVRPAEPAAPPEVRTAPPATDPVEEEAPIPVAVAPPAAPTPAPVRPSPAAPDSGGLVDGQTYTGEVPVPGGGAVKLNGIAYSPERPIAVLDGRVMAPGENIQGFTLVAIEAGRVKLQGFGATVFVSPK